MSLWFFSNFLPEDAKHPHITHLRHKQWVGLGCNKESFDTNFHEEGVGKTYSSFTWTQIQMRKFSYLSPRMSNPVSSPGILLFNSCCQVSGCSTDALNLCLHPVWTISTKLPISLGIHWYHIQNHIVLLRWVHPFHLDPNRRKHTPVGKNIGVWMGNRAWRRRY